MLTAHGRAMTGDEMRAWRQRHGLTQAQAADVLGVTPECVAGWERGRFAVGAGAGRLCDCWDVMRPEQQRRVLKRWSAPPSE